MNVSKYRKAIVAVGAAIGVIVAVTADGTLTTSDLIEIALAVAGALGVYSVENTEHGPGGGDVGLSVIETIVLVVIVVLAIFGVVYFFGDR